MKTYVLPAVWDAEKFAKRYNLDPFSGDFYVGGNGDLVVIPTLPDSPPIFEAPDPSIPAPAGIYVHSMAAMSKRVGNKLMDGNGTECFHIVVDTEALLADPWLAGIPIDAGSVAYVADKSKTLMWDGTKWK